MVAISESNNIFIYKLTTDNGGAPCVYKKTLSLAICKPKIRSVAEEDDWIVGFGGKATIGEKLIYIARITRKLDNGMYFKENKYFKRPDCIYRWDGIHKNYFWEKGKPFHVNGLWLEHDIGSKSSSYDKANTLLSNHFVYFGKNGDELYKSNYPLVKKLVENLKQNHRVNYPSSLRSEIVNLINKYIDCESSNIPSEDNFINICNNDNDSDCYYTC